jgi:hypothetical protein
VDRGRLFRFRTIYSTTEPAKTLAQINVTHLRRQRSDWLSRNRFLAPPVQGMSMLLVVHPGAAAREGFPMGAAEHLI